MTEQPTPQKLLMLEATRHSREIQGWLNRQSWYDPKTQKVAIELAFPPIDRRKAVTAAIRARRSVRGGTDVPPEAWEKILAIRWSPANRRVMEELRRRNSNPISGREIDSLLHTLFTCADLSRFNRPLQKAYIGFSLLKLPDNCPGGYHSYRLFEMKPEPRR